MIPTRRVLVFLSYIPIDIAYFRSGQVYIYAAHRVYAFFKCCKVYANISFNIHLKALAYLAHHKVCAAVAEGVGKPIVLTLIFPIKYRHAHTALKAGEFQRAVLFAYRHNHTAVASRVLAEAFGTLVRAYKQNI